MGFLQDILPIFKSQTIYLKEVRQESEDVFSFMFEGGSLDWKAGQHGMLLVDKQKLPKGRLRGFSVASAPGEGRVMVTTRVPQSNPSPYKQALKAMKAGDTMTLRGPFGPFYAVSADEPMVFIAGGIGITPFRSILSDVVDIQKKNPKAIELIYMDSRAEFVFKEELDHWAMTYPQIRIQYLEDRSDFQRAVEQTAKAKGSQARYFISGPGSFIKSVRTRLKRLGVPGKQIKNEAFMGVH